MNVCVKIELIILVVLLDVVKYCMIVDETIGATACHIQCTSDSAPRYCRQRCLSASYLKILSIPRAKVKDDIMTWVHERAIMRWAIKSANVKQFEVRGFMRPHSSTVRLTLYCLLLPKTSTVWFCITFSYELKRELLNWPHQPHL